jgi:peptide/nickel transport system permease protein
MIRFLARRFVAYSVMCLVATFLAYSLASLTFDPLADFQERKPPPPAAAIESKRQSLNLDQPIPQRFATWIGGVVTGDLGESVTQRELSPEFGRRVGVSLRLFIVGTMLGTGLGVLVGVWGALRQYRAFDQMSTFASYVLLSMPTFLIAMLIKYFVLRFKSATGIGWFKFTGEFTPGITGSLWHRFSDRLSHFVLPTLTIVLGEVAFFSRYQRNAMLDVLGSDYVRTARAKGLTKGQAVRRHGVRIALIPMATLFAFTFGLVITGGVFTERAFGWFGMGDWFVYGIEQKDTNIVAITTLFVAVCTLFAGWLSDVMTALLDPRVRRT